MTTLSQSPGVVTSFEHPVYSGGYFIGYRGWDKVNRKYGATNVTFLVRVEFDRWTYKHNRLHKTFQK